MDPTLSSPHRGGRRVRNLIRRWLVPPMMARAHCSRPARLCFENIASTFAAPLLVVVLCQPKLSMAHYVQSDPIGLAGGVSTLHLRRGQSIEPCRSAGAGNLCLLRRRRAHGLHAQRKRKVHVVGQLCFRQQQRGRVQEQCELREHAKRRADSERLLALEQRVHQHAWRSDSGPPATAGVTPVRSRSVSNTQLPERLWSVDNAALLLEGLRDGSIEYGL